MKLILILTLICVFLKTSSQEINIIVKDNHRQALIGAHVLLQNTQQKQYSYSTTTNEKGIATFKNIISGLYQITISFIGYSTVEKTIVVNNENKTFTFILKENAITLNEVTVSAPKPIIRQEEDKTIIDPEPVATTSSNTLEVLENTPGIYVDQDGGIFISGTTAATVYINGREQKLSNQDIANLLKNLPPNSVEKIEIIKNPSSKYDAATTGGIINIILKKNVKIGQFGSINCGLNQGIYGNRFLNLTYNNTSEISYYINANYNQNGSYTSTDYNRTLKPDTLLLQSTYTGSKTNTLMISFGGSNYKNEFHSFSYDSRIHYNFQNELSETQNNIQAVPLNSLSSSNNETFQSENNLFIQQDIGHTQKFDTIGSMWENKLSYQYHQKHFNLDYNNDIYRPISYLDEGTGKSKQHRHFIFYQSDLTRKTLSKITIETGIKSSYQSLETTTNYYKLLNGLEKLDTNKSTNYLFQEVINATYFQLSKKIIANIQIKTGIRFEQTLMKGKNKFPNNADFTINRVDPFPYVFISRPIFKIMNIELVTFLIYRRTITRPGYQDLNPSITYIDPYTLQTGNPKLKPQFTNNIEWNISFNEYPVFAAGINYTTDIFSQVVYKDSLGSLITIRTIDNLGKNTQKYLRGIAGIPPGGFYFFGVGAQYNIDKYKMVHIKDYLLNTIILAGGSLLFIN